jgi:hypothetical protein
MIARIEGTTRVCGKSQGYLGLPVRDETVDGVNIMHTAWEPTPDEIKRINQGAKIIVSVIGNNPQPIMLGVSENV